MYVLVLTEVSSATELEAERIAAELGWLAYDVRLVLAAGLPAVLHATTDRALAERLVTRFRARGTGVVLVDEATLVPSREMVAFRRFRFEAEGLRNDAGVLPYGDLSHLLKAQHVVRREAAAADESPFGDDVFRRSSPHRGGLEQPGPARTSRVTEHRNTVLYCFRRSRERPWILDDSSTRYDALGADRKPTHFENFERTVARLRELAPLAIYDERLLRVRRLSGRAREHFATTERGSSTSTVPGIDLLATAWAAWLENRRPTPYR